MPSNSRQPAVPDPGGTETTGERPERPAGTRGWFESNGAWLLLALILILVAIVRLRLAPVPLERDEGEYAYAAQLILQGIPPYELAYNMKFPGTYYAYAAILAVFGQTAWGVHAGLLLVNLATTLVIFLLIKRLFGPYPAALGAAGFAVLSVDRWILGVFAHATHFVLLPALAGLLLLLKALESGRLPVMFAAGALLGIAVLMKQHAIFYPMLAAGLITWSEWQRTASVSRTLVSMGVFGVGAAVPPIAIVVLLAAQGVLDRFWFWTVQYASTYVTRLPLELAWPSFLAGWKTVTQANLPLWLFGGCGLLLFWASRWPARTRVFMSVFLGSSLLALVPGLYFRPHYFILLLPVVAMGMAAVGAFLEQELLQHARPAVARSMGALLFLLLAGAYVTSERDYLTSMTPRDLSRARYGANPFIEAVEIAHYLRDNTAEDDRIAILGSEPEIYFYANRKSATGHIYTYALMEPQPFAATMQDEMMNEIEAARPKYLVTIGIPTSWLATPRSERRILNWMTRYVRNCYALAGVTEIIDNDTTIYGWGDEATTHSPQTENLLYTFVRRDPGPCTAPRD